MLLGYIVGLKLCIEPKGNSKYTLSRFNVLWVVLLTRHKPSHCELRGLASLLPLYK